MKTRKHFRSGVRGACVAAVMAALALSLLAPASRQAAGAQQQRQSAGRVGQSPQGSRAGVIVLPVVRRKRVTPADPRRTGLVRRAPIAFKPFAMVHPTTGKPFNPNAVMTLPSGRKLTVKSFFDQINQFEQKLSAQGYTLRKPAQLLPRRSAFSREKLQAQVAAAGARKMDAPQLAVRRKRQAAERAQSFSLSKKFEDSLKNAIDAKMGGGLGNGGSGGAGGGGGATGGATAGNKQPGGGIKEEAKTDSHKNSFSWHFPGDDEYFSAYLKGGVFLDKMHVGGQVIGVKALGNVTAGAVIFNPERLYDSSASNLKVDLASITVELSAGGISLLEHNRMIYRDVRFGTARIAKDQPPSTGAYTLNQSFELPYEISEQQTFMVFGVLPVTLSYGISAGVALDVNATVFKQGVTGGLTARCHLDASGQAVAGVPDIAWAGATLNVKVLDDRTNLYFNSFQTGPGRVALEGDHQFSALSGGMTLTAGFAHPCPDLVDQAKKVADSFWALIEGEDVPVPLCKTELSEPVWSFNGYSSSEALF